MSGVFFLYPQQVINSPGQQFVLNNAAVTIDGYQVISGFGSNELILIINIKNAPSGTLPTLTFTMQEVDPIDQTTAIGSSVNSAALNGVGTTILTKSDGTAGTVKVSWHITGSNNPVFTGVNVTVLQRVAGSSVEITDGTNTLGTPTHPIKIDPTGTTTQPVSGSVTANIGTTNGLALDATLTGGTAKTQMYDGTNTIGTALHPVRTDPTGTTTQPVSGSVTVTQATAANLNATVTGSVTANIGTTNGLALDATLTGGTARSRITDGTNTAAVKATSTAPAVTDPALVVAVSPNNSGTNAIQVQGTTPDNSVLVGNPIVAAGIDPNGRVQNLSVDGYGNIKVVTQTVPSGTSSFVSFGQANTGGTAGTLTALRATTYTEQTTNGQRSLKSTSVNDTALGTGARKVMITYFDASLNGPFTETVTLNGTSAVATVNNNICFIENMIVTNVGTAGSNGSNLGTISLYTDNAGLGTVIGSIGVGNIVTAGTVGDNRTLWAHHYISPTKTCSVTTISGGTTGNQTGVTFLRYINPLVSDACHIQITGELVVSSAESSMFRPSTVPLLVSGPAKITQYAVSNGTNTTFFGGFQAYDS